MESVDLKGIALSKSRYVMLTVDVEALPKRATSDHVKRLMWGEHPLGRAGVREISAIGQEFGVFHTFFVDFCGAYAQREEVAEVVKWLEGAGEDVQLHTHPEYLAPEFWPEQGFQYRPRFLNEYVDDKAIFTLQFFSKMLGDVTGKPVLGFRAGSFRWNAGTIRALAAAGIPLSFNNSMIAYRQEKCTYSEPSTFPFAWSNGIIEVPMMEKQFFPMFSNSLWGRMQYPFSNYFNKPLMRLMRPLGAGGRSDFQVMLLHSWSLLYWDELGHATYRDDRRIEEYRQLVRKLAKDYDIITTKEFLELKQRGEFGQLNTVDLALAELKPVSKPVPPASKPATSKVV
jgi:hypothetical protein